MNITIENRDLFTVPQGYYLAHCISADFALGAGIAKQFDEVYNMRYKLFKNYDDNYPDFEFDGGEALLVDNVFNLVTKPQCYNKPTYDTLREALEAMRTQMEYLDITKLAMPKIGCGLDRLQWDKVYDIICDVFKDADVDILICEL